MVLSSLRFQVSTARVLIASSKWTVLLEPMISMRALPTHSFLLTIIACCTTSLSNMWLPALFPGIICLTYRSTRRLLPIRLEKRSFSIRTLQIPAFATCLGTVCCHLSCVRAVEVLSKKKGRELPPTDSTWNCSGESTQRGGRLGFLHTEETPRWSACS